MHAGRPPLTPCRPPHPCSSSLRPRNARHTGNIISNKLVNYDPFASFTIGQDPSDPTGTQLTCVCPSLPACRACEPARELASSRHPH